MNLSHFYLFAMVIAKAVFEGNILLERDLKINFIAVDERGKILKIADDFISNKRS